MSKINKDAYIQLIRQDMDAVRASGMSSLEADHVCLVLAQSIDQHYPAMESIPKEDMVKAMEAAIVQKWRDNSYEDLPDNNIAQSCAEVAQSYLSPLEAENKRLKEALEAIVKMQDDDSNLADEPLKMLFDITAIAEKELNSI